MEEKEITQKMLSKYIGVQQQTISKWKNGACIHSSYFSIIADALDIQMSHLVFLSLLDQNLSDNELEKLIKEISERIKKK